MRTLLPCIFLAPALLLASCGDAGSDVAKGPDDASSKADGGDAQTSEGAWSFTTLDERTLKTNGVDVQVELIRADRPDGRRSYLLYQHALAAGAPLVIVNDPYAGIDWTGEEVDARWAKLGDGSQRDVDAPNDNGTDRTTYEHQTPQQAVDANVAWAFNGFATIHAYARFYAGGTLEDDALDAAAPYFFARTRGAEIDVTRIGSLGASWGGMMAIFGATHAPKDTPPRAVAAISAPSDFVDLWTWSETTLPAAYPRPAEAATFYSPYWRRATPTVGTPPAGAPALPFSHEGICPALPGRFLALHDAWDLLIPVSQTEDLAKNCPNVEALYWPRAELDYATAKFDHGPASSEGALPSIFTFSYTYVVEQVAKESAKTLYSIASRASLAMHLELMLAAQRAGKETAYVVPRLRELADARLVLFEAETQTQTPGAKLVADVVNGVWKTSFDEAGLRAQLATGVLPAPP